MFEALLERKKEADRKEFLRTAMITAAVINYSAVHPEKPVQIADLMPDMGIDRRKDLDEMAPQEAAAQMMSMFAKRTFTHH